MIASKEAAANACDKRAHILEQLIESQSITDLDTHKALKTEAGTACALRKEIARLKTVKDKAEMSVPKDTRTAQQIIKDKINELKAK
jgi:hypothetical protein